MKAVEFYKLPRAIQDRFVGSVMNGFPPTPIVAVRGGTRTKLAWLGVSAVAFVALIVVARLGFGSLDSGLALHSGKALPLYLGLVFAVAFGLVQAFACVVRERALPYTSGVHLFPGCLIDARSDHFRIFDVRELAGVEVQGAALRVTFAGGVAFAFPLAEPARAPEIIAAIHAARERSLHALESEDQRELVAIDPLHNPRFSSPVGPRDPYAVGRAPWGRFGPAIAAGLALVVAPLIWFSRNAGSDRTMYARATQANDAASYRLYLAHGERFAGDVADVLLPRAELRDAERAGTVDALLAYQKSHASTKIGREVAASVRAAMLAELEKAKQPGTLAALQAFARRYPDHGVGPELGVAVHAVYARELEAYKTRGPKKDALAFVEKLFAFAEKHGPRVEVRFRRKASSSLDRADQAVLKSPAFSGVVTYPSRFFDDKHAVAREAALASTIVAQLGSGLAPELFEVVTGAPVAEGEAPSPTVPTLLVTHFPEWSGHTYTSNRPRGAYVGLHFNFDASFVIPGEAKPYALKTDVFKHAATYVLTEPNTPMLAPGEAAEKVYGTMADGAFDEFGKRLLGGFFPPAKVTGRQR